jgi:putative sugar O-methyltransferase
MKYDDLNLLSLLNNDAKEVDPIFLAGPYWSNKTKVSLNEIRKNGIDRFRGSTSLISQSYGDNVNLDVTNLLRSNQSLLRKFAASIINKTPFQNILNKQLDLTEKYFLKTLKLYKRIFESDTNILQLINDYNIDDSTEFDCVYKVNINGKFYSIHYISLLQQLDFAMSKIDFSSVKTMFEIGGGFGATCHMVLNNFKRVKKYLYLDIFPNLYVGTQYLKSFFNDAVKDYSTTRDLKSIKFSSNDELQIFCIAPWQLKYFDSEIDLFYNSHSFVEMPKKVVQKYCNEITDKLTKKDSKIILISYDGFDLKTSLHPDTLPDFFKGFTFSKYESPLVTDNSRLNYYYISN